MSTKRAKPPASRQTTAPSTRAAPVSTAPTRALAGGRVSIDLDTILGGGVSVVLSPPSHEADWRRLNLDARTLETLSPEQLAAYLLDISPDVSRGVFDSLRELNAGWELHAFRPGTEEIDTVAEAALVAFVATLRDLYGSIDVPINRLYLSAWVRGAFFAELVLDEQGRLPIDLATPDPAFARFKRISDPVRGVIHELGQWQLHGWVPLDRPTIVYIPIDPLPGVPYGRPLVAPALFTALFMLGLLHDLRRVISQQGYPRADIEIDLAALTAQMPADLQDDPDATQAWVQAIVDSVVSAYRQLQPDDAYVHTSVVKVNRPVGTADAQSLGGIAGIIQTLERMSTRALKAVPFMMALDSRSSEATANREWESHLQATKSLQHLCESLLERLFGLALQAQGIAATVQMRFAENRASEEFRDAQTARLRVDIARAKYDNGWTSQDQAAQEGAGVDVADVPEPRQAASAPVPDPSNLGGVNPTPGENRAALARSRRAKVVPKGAGEPFAPIPATPDLSDDEREALADTWDATMESRYRGLLRAVVTNGATDG